jgi:hypothetical protein
MNTPKTDALHDLRNRDEPYSSYFLMLNLARDMERKNNAGRKLLDDLEQSLNYLASRVTGDDFWLISHMLNQIHDLRGA